MDRPIDYGSISGGSNPSGSANRDKKVIVALYGNVPIKGYPGNRFYGAIAQLGERLPCKQGVESSNLSGSTK